MRAIDNSQSVIDSRDIIERIEELEGELSALQSDLEECDQDDTELYIGAAKALQDWIEDNRHELETLRKLAEEGENSPDWTYGETLVRGSYFTEYTEQLIDDCYEMIPKEFDSGDWPYRHMSIDYDAAADELKYDYFELDYDGVTYWIRG